jgi:subtilase family serine protease
MRSKPVLLSLAIILLTSLSFAQDTRQIRIVRPVDNRSVVRLQGTMHPRARVELDRGPVSGAMPMQQVTMVFSRTAAQQADLDQLLAAQQDRSSPNYHKWLTPEEFGDRFGLAAQDVNLVAAWLQSQGFTVDEISRSRTWIAFSGIAAQIDSAFHTSIHNYAVDGQTHYAPSAEPSVPEAFSGVVAAISGLHDFRPRQHSRVRHPSPRVTSSLSGNHYLAPGDFGTIYNLPDYVNGVFQPGNGNDGIGQTIGIVGQATDTTVNGITSIAIPLDNATFRSVSGLPAGSLTVTPVGSPNNFDSGEFDEAALDIQWSGAVAPNAAIIFAYSTNALTTSLQYLVTQSPASVISLSYGDCEANFTQSDIQLIETLLQQANLQGQTVTAAAGDTGAADCDGTAQKPVTIATHGLAVDYPASSVYVTAMGGTAFSADSAAIVTNGSAAITQYWNGSSNANDPSTSAFSYIPETVWNDTATTGTNVGTGGGVSNCAFKNSNNQCSSGFLKPWWQTGTGVPQDGYRDVPDVSLTSSPSHDGYITCSQGSCQTGYRRNSDQTFTIIGGTSAAAPTFAGVIALVNQKLGSSQGNFNQKIYSLAANSPWAFNDITTGDNKVNCTVGSTDCTASPIGYAAAPGYDLATGWGSVDVIALLDALNGTPNPHFLVLPNSRYETVLNSSNVNVGLTITPKEGFSGTVTLTCTPSSSLAGTTCSLDNISVNTPGSAIMLIQGSGSGQPSETGTVTVTGTSGSMTDSVAINVSIIAPDFSLASGNSTETVTTGGSTTDNITLTSLQGFAGGVAISCTGTTGLTCSLGSGLVTLSANSSATDTLTVNAATSATTGSITISANNGSVTHTLQIPVTVTVVPPDFGLGTSPAALSLTSAQTGTSTITVTPSQGFTSDVGLTCAVSPSLAATTCSLSPTTVTGGSGTSTLTIHAATLAMDRSAPLPFLHRGIGAYATFVFALGMVFTMKPRRSPRARSWRNRLLGLLLLGVMLGLVSCGGGGGGSTPHVPTPLSGTVTVTGGTSAGVTHSIAIPVTIN